MLAVDFIVSPQVVAFLTTLLIPVAVALVSKSGLSDRWRAVLTLILAAVHTLVVDAIDPSGAAVISGATFQQWMLTTAIAVFAYVGLLKPLTNGTLNDRILPNIGFGKAA
jgi:hypothetical protein